jgi:ribosome-associated protein
LKSATLARRIAALALTKKAHDVTIMDLHKVTSMADFFVICSGDSDIQVKAIADAVEEGLEKKGNTVWHREAGSSNWVLLDYVDVVLHVFHKHTRSFYNLEKLWGDAEFESVTEKDDAPAQRRSRGTKDRGTPMIKRKMVS